MLLLGCLPIPFDSLTVSVIIRFIASALSKKTCQANQASENGLFIFTVCVRSVPSYHFKLAYVILQIAVKNFSKPTSKNGDMNHLNL